MDLAHWMTANKIPPNVANFSRRERQRYLYRSIFGLVSGICYLHQEVEGRVITHHDLKPLNILMVDDELKIADFGHAHLRPTIEGSASEGRLGSYEYQPPEYYNRDGSRAQGKYGRAFDVWAVGCIILELTTLIVDDWQSGMVINFREKRKNNRSRERRSPPDVDDNEDFSFHNNLKMVKDWLSHLKQRSDSPQLNEVLKIADGMLVLEPENRVYMWEALMDLHKALKFFGELIPNLGESLCIAPPLGREYSIIGFGRERPEIVLLRDSIKWRSETPLHRAARNKDKRRTIRLWELGWPLSMPDFNKKTPLDLMKTSDDIGLRKLEENVNSMIDAARTGDIEVIKSLLRMGLSPLMVTANGRSALFEATENSQVKVIDYLLKSNTTEQVMLSDRQTKLRPLHMAARVGSVEALERLLKYLDVNICAMEDICDGFSNPDTALLEAIAHSQKEAVCFLIKNQAKLAPSSGDEYPSWTALHAAVSKCQGDSECFEILKLLLEADGSRQCINQRSGTGLTPLMMVVVRDRSIKLFELLFNAGASIHSDPNEKVNLIDKIAERGRDDILQQYIHHFNSEDLERRKNSMGYTPWEAAFHGKHHKTARLLKNRLAQIKKTRR